MAIFNTAVKAAASVFDGLGAAQSIGGDLSGLLGGRLDVLNRLGLTPGFGGPVGGFRADKNPADLRASLHQSYFARTNFFEVIIPPPLLMGGASPNAPFRLYAQSTMLPTVSVATSDVRRHGFGPIEKFGYAPIFNDIDVTFIGDGKGELYEYFYNWIRGITSFDHQTTSDEIDKRRPFQVGFKADYMTDLSIYTFNEQQEEVQWFQLMRAFPLSIQTTPLNWADTDTLMAFTVQFSYYNYRLNYQLPEPSGSAAGGATELDRVKVSSKKTGGDILQKAMKVGSAIQVLGSLKRPQTVADVVNVVSNAKIAVSGMKRKFP